MKVTLEPGDHGKDETELYDMVRGRSQHSWPVRMQIPEGAGGHMPITEAAGPALRSARGWKSGKVLEELYAQGLLKELDQFKLLLIHGIVPGNLFLRNKKVTKLEDMAGLKDKNPLPNPLQRWSKH